MKTKSILALVTLLATILLTTALSLRIGVVPPLGKLMSPYQGFWQNTESGEIEDLALPAHVSADVRVYYDARGVPHIFASNDADLYFAAGFVTARDRLWQMDFYSRAAAGRLAEILGNDALNYDRRQRRMGMLEGAERLLDEIQSDPQQRAVLDAYVAGVNAWIETLSPKQYPLEFKVFDYTPEPFQPINAALMVMNIAQTLTARSYAHSRTNAQALLADDVLAAMYPTRLPNVQPMIPDSHDWLFDPVVAEAPGDFVPQLTQELPIPQLPVGAGSNSWAVDGTRTASGNPILASDPHLGVTYPAIWYEMQLVSDTVNAYGVALPAAPGIAIGFNENLAWGVTSGTSASMDIYEIEFRDDAKAEYLHDGEWKAVTVREERIKIRGAPDHTELVHYTHHGPVVQSTREPGGEPASSPTLFSSVYPIGHAVRWIAREGGDILRATYNYNRASDVDEFHEAMRDYTTINMNYLVADRHGNISAGHYGRLPVRWEGQGDTISDGRDPLYDWQADIPFEHLPYVKNPPRGFVFNANQIPVGENYPYWLGIEYAGYSRPNRIHGLLEQMNDITPRDFEYMLRDSFHTSASDLLPVILPVIEAAELNETEQQVVSILKSWDFNFSAGSAAATVFNAWQVELRNALWQPLLNDAMENDIFLRAPTTDTISAQIVNGLTRFAVPVEQAAKESFRTTVESLTDRLGDNPDLWTWGTSRRFFVPHLANVPGLSSDRLAIGGHSSSINAIGSFFAPSWRMVVELTPEGPVAKGHYAGGQSGNSGSPRYDNMTEDWTEGRLQQIQFWQTEDEARKQATAVLTLHSKRPDQAEQAQ